MLPVLFCVAVKLRYDLAVGDIPSNCVFGELFNVSQSMIYKGGGFAILSATTRYEISESQTFDYGMQ